MVMPALESVRLGKTRNEAAACLTATVLIAPADTYFLKLSVAVGDVVRLLDDGGKEIFLGSVHELDRTPETVTLTAYDRGVYLTRNELYGVYTGTGRQIAGKIAGELGIPLGAVEDDGLYRVKNKQKYFDVNLMGGIGYTKDCRISRLWRDQRVYRIGAGTDEIMIHIAGRAIQKQFAPSV